MVGILELRHISFIAILALVFTGLTGCASSPSAPRLSAVGSAADTSALTIARDMIGVPYRYGGSSPRGFDCSGLVYYSYRKAGIEVPRTTGEQYRQSRRVKMSSLQPGDLIFFKISRTKLSHVGIYAGDGRFIHAPSSGKHVSYAVITDPYWESRVVGAGRLQ